MNPLTLTKLTFEEMASKAKVIVLVVSHYPHLCNSLNREFHGAVCSSLHSQDSTPIVCCRDRQLAAHRPCVPFQNIKELQKMYCSLFIGGRGPSWKLLSITLPTPVCNSEFTQNKILPLYSAGCQISNGQSLEMSCQTAGNKSRIPDYSQTNIYNNWSFAKLLLKVASVQSPIPLCKEVLSNI